MGFVPIYERLVRLYLSDIKERRLSPGKKIDSITEIQQKHRVSRETAKKVLSILAEEGFLVQKAGMGSFVANVGPRQRLWGVILPFYSIQYEDLLSRITCQAATMDREIRHFCDHNNWQEEIRLVGNMLHESYEAIIVIPTTDESQTRDFYSRLSPQDSLVMMLDHTMTHNAFPCSIQSYDLGVARGIQYLIEQKEGGIAFVRNEVWAGRNMVEELMEETYKDFLQRFRKKYEPVVIMRPSQINGQRLYNDGITGIFCCDDTSAIQTIGTIKEQGILVPQQINVVSYGNTALARYFTPKITSIDPHNAEMADNLLKMISPGLHQNKVIKKQLVTQPDLIIRQT